MVDEDEATQSRDRSRAALERIASIQERYPQCPCGQRTKNPNGICSKTTPQHAALVAEARWRT